MKKEHPKSKLYGGLKQDRLYGILKQDGGGNIHYIFEVMSLICTQIYLF